MQHLGLIERSPSPEPDHKLIAQRTEEMLRMEKEARRKANLEILRLRVRSMTFKLERANVL